MRILNKIRGNRYNSSKKDSIEVDNKSPYSMNIPVEGIIYDERDEIGAKNLEVKNKRVEEGGPFEWPNIVALNQAIGVLIKDSKEIYTIGSGTGTFEWFASVDSSKNFISSEFDTDCVKWCKENRQRENIEYTSYSNEELLSKYGKLDLAVTVEVIEHIKDYKGFLQSFSNLADRAIISTPNRDRSLQSALSATPPYYQHVREWDAGELYWILKNFYENVELYSMPDVYLPEIKKVGVMTVMTPLIAYCYN